MPSNQYRCARQGQSGWAQRLVSLGARAIAGLHHSCDPGAALSTLAKNGRHNPSASQPALRLAVDHAPFLAAGVPLGDSTQKSTKKKLGRNRRAFVLQRSMKAFLLVLAVYAVRSSCSNCPPYPPPANGAVSSSSPTPVGQSVVLTWYIFTSVFLPHYVWMYTESF